MRWKQVVAAATLPGFFVLAFGLFLIPHRLALLMALLAQLALSLTLGFLQIRKAGGWDAPSRWRYQPRPTEAGHWLDAPVAELDKSTTGRLLASRLGRVPGLHVDTRPRPPRDDGNPLYDAELDG
jgi:hypothetical protein